MYVKCIQIRYTNINKVFQITIFPFFEVHYNLFYTFVSQKK